MSPSEIDGEHPYAVNVTLTSKKLRSNQKAHTGKKSAEGAETVKEESFGDNVLPVEKCLLGLAEMRHARWFMATAAAVPSCIECIRVIKELSQRDPVKPFSIYAHHCSLLMSKTLLFAGLELSERLDHRVARREVPLMFHGQPDAVRSTEEGAGSDLQRDLSSRRAWHHGSV